MIVYEDNQSAIKISRNYGDPKKSKHVDGMHHFVRKPEKLKIIKVTYNHSRICSRI